MTFFWRPLPRRPLLVFAESTFRICVYESLGCHHLKNLLWWVLTSQGCFHITGKPLTSTLLVGFYRSCLGSESGFDRTFWGFIRTFFRGSTEPFGGFDRTFLRRSPISGYRFKTPSIIEEGKFHWYSTCLQGSPNRWLRVNSKDYVSCLAHGASLWNEIGRNGVKMDQVRPAKYSPNIKSIHSNSRTFVLDIVIAILANYKIWGCDLQHRAWTKMMYWNPHILEFKIWGGKEGETCNFHYNFFEGRCCNWNC